VKTLANKMIQTTPLLVGDTDRTGHHNIRLAKTDDVAALVELGRNTFAIAYGDIVEVDDMKFYLSNIFAPELIRSEIAGSSVTYLLAECESELMAYAKLVETPEPVNLSAGRVIELVRLYVRDGESGKGIGSAMLAAVEKRAREAGYSGIWLRVWEKNEAAIRFYERHDFQLVGSEPYLIGNTANPVVLMFNQFR